MRTWPSSCARNAVATPAVPRPIARQRSRLVLLRHGLLKLGFGRALLGVNPADEPKGGTYWIDDDPICTLCGSCARLDEGNRPNNRMPKAHAMAEPRPNNDGGSIWSEEFRVYFPGSAATYRSFATASPIRLSPSRMVSFDAA
jgi:hypothetical protein